MMGMSMGAGLHNNQSVPGTPFLATMLTVIDQSDGTMQVETDARTLTITITNPPIFAGTYQVFTEALAAGPVNLAPPVISGIPVVGASLNSTPGLWLYEADLGEPTFGLEWFADGIGITGATSPSLASTPVGTLFVRETVIQSGTLIRAQDSASIEVM